MILLPGLESVWKSGDGLKKEISNKHTNEFDNAAKTGKKTKSSKFQRFTN